MLHANVFIIVLVATSADFCMLCGVIGNDSASNMLIFDNDNIMLRDKVRLMYSVTHDSREYV